MGRVINVTGDNAESKSTDFQPIPAGTKVLATVYAVEETTVRSQESANFGKPQLDITFKVQDDRWQGREIRYQKIPLYDGNAAWKLIAFADAVGWPHEGGVVELPDDFNTVLGKPLVIKVDVEPANAKNQVFNRVTGYAPASSFKPDAAGSTGASDAPSWGNLNS